MNGEEQLEYSKTLALRIDALISEYSNYTETKNVTDDDFGIIVLTAISMITANQGKMFTEVLIKSLVFMMSNYEKMHKEEK